MNECVYAVCIVGAEMCRCTGVLGCVEMSRGVMGMMICLETLDVCGGWMCVQVCAG